MLKVLLIDDEHNVTEALSSLLRLNHPDVHICASCSSISQAVEAIQLHKPDILLLDIELGDQNGFDIFKHFPRPDFQVVFVTAYRHYAVEAFRFAALDYLLKPVDPDLLAEALKKANSRIDKERLADKISSYLHNMTHTSKDLKKIVLKTADTLHLIHLHDIVYCEADRSYTSFYMNDKSRILVSVTMGHYEDLFKDYGFFRIHQSYLINLDYFKRYEKNDGGKAILKDGSSLPVATRKKDQLLQILSTL